MIEADINTSEATVNPQELVERARNLVPQLRLRAFDADEARRVPDETMRELLNAQLFQILVPRRFGGFAPILRPAREGGCARRSP